MEKLAKLPVAGKGNPVVADIHELAGDAVACLQEAREHLDELYDQAAPDTEHDYARASYAIGMALRHANAIRSASSADGDAVAAAMRVQ